MCDPSIEAALAASYSCYGFGLPRIDWLPPFAVFRSFMVNCSLLSSSSLRLAASALKLLYSIVEVLNYRVFMNRGFKLIFEFSEAVSACNATSLSNSSSSRSNFGLGGDADSWSSAFGTNALKWLYFPKIFWNLR